MLTLRILDNTVTIQGSSVVGLADIDLDFILHLQQFYSTSFGDVEHWFAAQLIDVFGGTVLSADPVAAELVTSDELTKFNPHHGDHGHFASADGASAARRDFRGNDEAIGGYEEDLHASWRKQLTVPEKQAVKDYTSDASSLNRSLRTDTLPSPDTMEGKRLQGIVTNLDAAIGKHSIENELVVYRGLKASRLTQLKAGDEFTDKAFVSTSLSLSKAYSFSSFHNTMTRSDEPLAAVRITLKPGTKAAPINGGSTFSGEHEVLLPRNTRFKVLSHETDSGKLLVNVEAL